MDEKSLRPKCTDCERKATKWDGGSLSQFFCSKENRMKPYPIVYLCDVCDDGNNFFSLPDSLEEAIDELVLLREKHQLLFESTFDPATSSIVRKIGIK